MGELIQANFSVIHTDDDSNKSTRFMDETISHVPISHNTGKATLPGGTKDHEIASSVTTVHCAESNAVFCPPVTFSIA